MMVRSSFLAAALVAAFANPANAAPIKCQAARDDVEQTICAHPELLATDKAMSDRLETLKRRCESSRKLLVQGQKFWMRERWDCRSEEGVFEKPDRLASCLSRRMDRRLQQLNEIDAGCDLTPLSAAYRFVDVDYMLRFGDQYLGKPVNVFGWMDLASCKASHAAPTVAHIVGKDIKRDRLRAVFSAMPGERLDFLCANHPVAHWNGTIQHDSQGNYLFLTDVLGEKLPASTP